jgi:NADH dehydrogenase (ubiquinone) Fe-S protein 8
MSPLSRTPVLALRAAFAAGASAGAAGPSSRIIPLLATTATRQFSSAPRRLAEMQSGDVQRMSHADDILPGSAKKQAQASPASLVGGRVGVIAPSQALTDDWAIQRDYPDYSKGPSALDKASRLFFFSEILRGMWVV